MKIANLFLVVFFGFASIVSAQDKSKAFVERLDPSFDALVGKGVEIEWLGEGFKWTEGPVWVKV